MNVACFSRFASSATRGAKRIHDCRSRAAYPPPQATANNQRPQPDWAAIHRELRRAGVSSIDLQASQLSTEFALFTVTDGAIRGLPPNAPEELAEAIRRAARTAPHGRALAESRIEL
jgi:hypothetical protein